MLSALLKLSRYDAIIYSLIFGAGRSGTHNLYIIEDADHNFTDVSTETCCVLALLMCFKHRDEVVEAILKWRDELDGGRLKTGMWGSPPVTKGRL